LANNGQNQEAQAYLASGGLILFNALAFYELLVPYHPHLKPLRQLKERRGTWKGAMKEGFEAANEINYQTVFDFAGKVLDILPTSSTVESALEELYVASEYVVSHAGLLRHDLTGRIYHTLLGKELRKAYATYYTGIPAAELLAWLTIDKWDAKVVDFACGSGTLLVAAYHRKLALPYLQKRTERTDELHSKFVQEDIWGFDAMAFASHLSMVNLALQQPAVTFSRSHIYHVPTGNAKLGSLDLLTTNKIPVQERIQGGPISASLKSMTQTQYVEVEVPKEGFDLVIMNPPFTRKDRVTRVLNTELLKKRLQQVNPNLSTVGGLAVAFVQLAHKYVRSSGHIAFVLPTAVLSRDAWQGVRKLLADNYQIKHIIVSWIPGKPAFSENTELREILLVARKNGKESRTAEYTIISHLDEDPSFIECRQIAEVLKALEQAPSAFSILQPITQTLHSETRTVGQCVSVPVGLMRQSSDNWYRLVAFRNIDLVKAALHLEGLLPQTNPPFGLNYSNFLCSLGEIADVMVYVTNVGSAGLKIVESTPLTGGIPALMTSNFNKILIETSDLSWLVRKPSARQWPVNQGTLLTCRRTDVYNTMRVSAAVSNEPIAANMWFPVQPHDVTSKDGKAISSSEVGKIIALWLNSTYGILLMLAEREETRGAWVEWKTERTKQLKVLDPRRLTSGQTRDLLNLWNKLYGERFELLHEQLTKSQTDNNTPRRVMDEGIAKILVGYHPKRLNDLYASLSNDLERLVSIMK
jgi:hypothetical protein